MFMLEGGFKSTYYIIEINRRINREGGREEGSKGERERRKKMYVGELEWSK